MVSHLIELKLQGEMFLKRDPSITSFRIIMFFLVTFAVKLTPHILFPRTRCVSTDDDTVEMPGDGGGKCLKEEVKLISSKWKFLSQLFRRCVVNLPPLAPARQTTHTPYHVT